MFLSAVPSFSSESLGRFEGKSGDKSVVLDATIWAYVPSLKGFQIEIAFPKVTPPVNDDKMLDLNWFHIGPFTPELFSEVFDSNKSIKDLFLTDHIYDSHLKATSEGNLRIITVDFQGRTTAYVPEPWRRAQIVIRLEQGKSLSVSMKREYNMNGKWVSLFENEATGLRMEKSGVAILDRGEMGRLTKPELIMKACANTYPTNLHKLLDSEKK
ncbi:MAG: hypothetical protein HQM09_19820 [Candidatus Riflebacteria bacterium]|nr:hypothetical protein [Candidatus Riflebacteria bacterium]